MTSESKPSFTAFVGPRRIAAGALRDVAVAVHTVLQRDRNAMPLVFNDATGEQVDIDLRGKQADVVARYAEQPAAEPAPAEDTGATRGRGRPRMGVIAREVTLLPEHWDWLAAQPGGASVVLRKLVHDAKRAGAERDRQRRAQERAFRIMGALAGNLPGFEEASRALFAGKPERLAGIAQAWPPDVLDYVMRLADSGHEAALASAD